MRQLEGESAVVTGTPSGIGRAAVRAVTNEEGAE